jgi:hypothetical protein
LPHNIASYNSNNKERGVKNENETYHLLVRHCAGDYGCFADVRVLVTRRGTLKFAEGSPKRVLSEAQRHLIGFQRKIWWGLQSAPVGGGNAMMV